MFIIEEKSNASQMNIVTKSVVKKLLKAEQYSNGGMYNENS
jgi:hypothetical protein